MLSGLFARVKSLWTGIRSRDAVEAEMSSEFQHHLELRAADLMRSGMKPDEAARQARHEFGMVEVHSGAARGARGLKNVDRIRFSWLDLKLGFRMLGRYPGLTIVGGLAIAFAIWVGASVFEFIGQMVRPSLPLNGGERVVSLRLWNAETSDEEFRVAFDFAAWRRELRTVGDLGAYRALQRNLTITEGYGEPVEVVEISASAFRLAPEPPLFGRGLLPADELEGAPAVLVLAFDLWRTRFGADTGIVGRVIRLGGTATTIVGVMPRGFKFPITPQLWAPTRLQFANYLPADGPGLKVFGRLAPGARIEDAQTELASLGSRLATDHPLTHRSLRPQVRRFEKSIISLDNIESAALMSMNLFLALLLVLICGNVALLLFARAATRESEIVVRSALGAGRGRIVGQFVAEALALGGLAAIVGLIATKAGLRWWLGVIDSAEGNLPFWFSDTLRPWTIVYALALMLLSAAIMGILPALKVTRRLADRLRASAAGGGGPSIGGIWTVLIVGQIAVTVAFPVLTYFIQRDVTQIKSLDVGFADSEYLTALVGLDPVEGDTAAVDRMKFQARFSESVGKLNALLREEGAVRGVTFGDRLPRMYHEHRLVELDSGAAAPLNPAWPAYRVSAAYLDHNFFDVVGVPILQGRNFHSGDVAKGSRTIIVNESFVRLVLGGRNPIGRQVRIVKLENQEQVIPAEERGPWYEIVGVVRDMGLAPYQPHDPKYAGFYFPVDATSIYPIRLAIHVNGDPITFGPRLRYLAEKADASLQIDGVRSLDSVQDGNLQFYAFWMQITTVLCGMALLLSLAGIYSVMSFTVARRTREIGVRVALGADRRRLIMTVFRRPLRQVAIGVAVGTVLVTLLAWSIMSDRMGLMHLGLIVAYAILMLGVCLVACAMPTRRALAIEPTEALRAE